MSKFKKNKSGEQPAISTASLPDIVFMLLFFFMVTTVMREQDLLVKVSPPEATEAEKIDRKDLVSYIYIGSPIEKLKATYGSAPRIQLNDQFATKEQIAEYVEVERQKINEVERPLITFSLKVDKDCEMGVVTDVKQELRKAQALKINYSSRKIDKIK
jgi:biopolymer transport protein ExbD